MKPIIITLCGLIMLAGCTKMADQSVSGNPQPTLQLSSKQNCDFGMSSFNLAKRALIYDGRRPVTGGGNIPPPPANTNVLLLDFDGQLVSGTSWNSNGDFTCAPANLSPDAINEIIERVANDYSPFNVIVTTDEAVFNACTGKRTRVIVTESWEWYGQAGGTSILNTWTVGSITPCFVFSSLLNYNTKQIGEAASHEAGHTVGLRHQSVYDANGIKLSEYNYGQGSGEIGWAPIMGCGYYQNLSLWHRGPNAISATTIQDDEAVFASSIGYKADDYSNSISGATPLASSLNGIINNSTDQDFFSVSLTSSKTVTLTPYNVGINDEGADVDLIARVYNSQGNLLSANENPNTLNASTVLAPGNYYISVGTTPNTNTSTYGMTGKYNISLN